MPAPRKGPKQERGYKLADYRLERGLTQAGLARRLDLSRQFLNQVEAGGVLPNVAVALRMAAELGRTVEELFGDAARRNDARVKARLAPGAEQLGEGARLRLGKVGGAWVAHAADTPGTAAAGYAAADAILAGGGWASLLAPAAQAGENLLVAGCDPALAVLQQGAPAGGGRVHWIDAGSGRALDLLEEGAVHAAGIHYPGVNGGGNLRAVRARGRGGEWSLLRFTSWDQGWLVRRDRAEAFRGAKDLGSGKWRLANREETSAARRWLDETLEEAGVRPAAVRGHDAPGGTAAEGARAVLAGAADVTVGPQAVAVAMGLGFVPGESVDFDLVVPRAALASAPGRLLRACLAHAEVRRILAGLPGYAADGCGESRAAGASRAGRARRVVDPSR